jgi:hypothetical protein
VPVVDDVEQLVLCRLVYEACESEAQAARAISLRSLSLMHVPPDHQLVVERDVYVVKAGLVRPGLVVRMTAPLIYHSLFFWNDAIWNDAVWPIYHSRMLLDQDSLELSRNEFFRSHVSNVDNKIYTNYPFVPGWVLVPSA